MTDEELLLRMMLPSQQVDAIERPRRVDRAARPRPQGHPVRELIGGLVQRGVQEFELDSPGVKLRLRR